jgi:periplasmic divalent cation tolerance protein
MTGKIVVIASCGSEEEAARIAGHLVSEKLAACVSVIPKVRSFYRWEGRVEDSAEVLMLIKSSHDLFDRLRSELQARHSYQIPEVLALPVLAGAPNYLAWMDGELAQ